MVVLVLVVGGEEEDTGREGTETVVVADDSETVGEYEVLRYKFQIVHTRGMVQ